MSADPLDYSLWNKHMILQGLNLAYENYNTPLFIHPPFFVAVCTVLHRFFGVHLVALPLLFQGAAAAFSIWSFNQLLVMTDEGKSISQRIARQRILWFTLLFCAMCPLSVFCAQKFWIDNCLVFTMWLCFGCHIWLTNFSIHKTIGVQLLCVFLSGVLFGSVACMTKITALGGLPAMIFYTSMLLWRRQITLKESFKIQGKWFLLTFLWVASVLLLGTVIGYSPWMYIHYVSVQS